MVLFTYDGSMAGCQVFGVVGGFSRQVRAASWPLIVLSSLALPLLAGQVDRVGLVVSV